jgi:hypothetical protein
MKQEVNSRQRLVSKARKSLQRTDEQNRKLFATTDKETPQKAGLRIRDLGSGAFFTLGSGNQNRFFPDFGSWTPDPGTQTHIVESLVTIVWIKSSIILWKLAQIFFFSISKIKKISIMWNLWLQKKVWKNFFFTPLFCFCFWIRDPRSGFWDPGSEIQDPRSRIWDPRSGIPDPGSQIRDLRFGIRDLGSEIRDPRSKIQDLGSRILGDLGSGIRDKHPGSATQPKGLMNMSRAKHSLNGVMSWFSQNSEPNKNSSKDL